jgi:hypothetical protein
VCPLHAWKVRLDTGAVVRPAAHDKCVATYATRIDGGIVLVELPLAKLEGPEDAETRFHTGARSNGGRTERTAHHYGEVQSSRR